MKAEDIATKAAEMVGGARNRQHGSKRENHQNIADHWNAYLMGRIDPPLTDLDAALMMAEMKIARTKAGDHNPDDYLDLCGYGACAGEIADEIATEASLKFGDTTDMETTGPLGERRGGFLEPKDYAKAGLPPPRPEFVPLAKDAALPASAAPPWPNRHDNLDDPVDLDDAARNEDLGDST